MLSIYYTQYYENVAFLTSPVESLESYS